MPPLFSRRRFLKTAAVALAAGAEMEAIESQAATPLPRRVLGKTGVAVSILGFGTAPCGIRRNISNGVELYHQAMDLGINYFDTAPLHTGYGIAQKQLGHALQGRRKDVFLVTKCHEARGDDAMRLLERNLKELQTDTADLVHVHSLGSLDLDVAMRPGGVIPALMEAKRQGLIRFVGLSGHHRPQKFETVLRAFDVDVLMNAVNFADRHTYGFEQKVWPAAALKQVGLVAMKVFGGADWSSTAMVNSMMPQKHLAAAFRYALSVPRVSCAVIGMATAEELQQNVRWARQFRPMTNAEIAALAPTGRQLADRWGPHFGAVA